MHLCEHGCVIVLANNGLICLRRKQDGQNKQAKKEMTLYMLKRTLVNTDVNAKTNTLTNTHALRGILIYNYMYSCMNIYPTPQGVGGSE